MAQQSIASLQHQQLPHTTLSGGGVGGMLPMSGDTHAVCDNLPSSNITGTTTNLININISNNASGTVTSVATGENHQTPAQMLQQQQLNQQLQQQQQGSKEMIGFNSGNGGEIT